MSNGRHDPGEPGIGGIEIVITDQNRNSQSTTTMDNGEYWFEWLRPGDTYTVREVLPGGSVQTTSDPPELFISSGKEWVADDRQGLNILRAVEFPWWLQIRIQPESQPDPVDLMLEGMPTLVFGDPLNLNTASNRPTFDIVDPENGLPNAVPEDDGPWMIPFELRGDVALADPEANCVLNR